ncbi:MAG TPA: gliding motility-associated C-terminal domain-containing protein, partial [Adhaeribacter sp.]|nr:gliding motility-associated C-terminal domain-containing protein [Adhaeribacter sp.]
NPNALGLACNYQQGPTLAQLTNSKLGLPNFMASYFAPPRFNYTGFCAGSPVSFTITNQAGIDSVVWNFDDPASGSRNQSKQLQPSHSFTAPGMFMVTLKIYSQGFESVHERLVEIKSTPQVDIGRDTTLCDGQTIQLRNKFPLSPFNERFLWSTGDTTATLTAGAPGIYWLELNNGTCTFRDSMEIKINPQPKVDLGGNKSFCGNQPYTLKATVNLPGATYFWSPGGETTPTLTVTKSGEYEVLVDVNGCQATDKAQITFRTILNFELGPDITVCEGEIVTLRTVGPTPTTFYTWSDGTRHTSVLNPTQSGTYWVEIKRDGCTVTDTVNVTFLPCPPPPVPLIPNIITPNGDGLNDLFVLKEIPEGAWNLKLFNRWGIEIFNRKGYRNTWPETEINDGTYYYFLEDPDTGRTWKGWLEVVR